MGCIAERQQYMTFSNVEKLATALMEFENKNVVIYEKQDGTYGFDTEQEWEKQGKPGRDKNPLTIHTDR